MPTGLVNAEIQPVCFSVPSFSVLCTSWPALSQNWPEHRTCATLLAVVAGHRDPLIVLLQVLAVILPCGRVDKTRMVMDHKDMEAGQTAILLSQIVYNSAFLQG